MINGYSFTIETSPNYYNILLEVTKEETIGKFWILQSLVGAMTVTVGLFFLVWFFGYMTPLETLLYIWIIISFYYLFTMYKFSKNLQEEYSISNLATKPKIITFYMSESNIQLKEDNTEVLMTWNDINGFEERKEGLFIGYLDGQIIILDTNHLEPEKYKKLIDLIKSKLAQNNMNESSSSFIPLIASIVTAVLGIIIFYAFGYIVYHLYLDTDTQIKIIVIGIFAIVTLIVALSFFYIARREWKIWKDLKESI